MLIFSLGISSCKYNAASLLENSEVDYILRAESEACYGTCPVYTLDINAKRNLSFQGARYCAFQGDTVLKLKEEDYLMLKNTLLESGFFAMDTVYDNPDMMDAPSYSISVSDPLDKFEPHSVRGRVDTPEAFDRLKKSINKLLVDYGLLKG